MEQRWARKEVARFEEGAVVDGRGGGGLKGTRRGGQERSWIC